MLARSISRQGFRSLRLYVLIAAQAFEADEGPGHHQPGPAGTAVPLTAGSLARRPVRSGRRHARRRRWHQPTRRRSLVRAGRLGARRGGGGHGLERACPSDPARRAAGPSPVHPHQGAGRAGRVPERARQPRGRPPSGDPGGGRGAGGPGWPDPGGPDPGGPDPGGPDPGGPGWPERSREPRAATPTTEAARPGEPRRPGPGSWSSRARRPSSSASRPATASGRPPSGRR